MENAILIEHLNKSYGEVRAVQDLSFTVKKGELFAFLGVNGAGKSTTISMICGQLRRDSGRVEVCGMDLDHKFDAVKRRIGVVFQNSLLDAPLSARENLKSRAALYGVRGKEFEARYRELADLLDFGGFDGRPLSKLSGGQKRRIDIARALFHRPEILILDEPTTGLDPQTRKLLWDVIDDLRRKRDLTVFLTTHYMEEAAEADHVIILDGGKIAAEGSPLELKNRYAADSVTLYGCEKTEAEILGFPAEPVKNGVRVRVPNTRRVTQLILAHPELFRDYEVEKGKMDDVFLAVTGKSLPGGGAK